MTTWKNLQPGELQEGLEAYDATEEAGEGALVICGQPDWVRDPQTGEKVRCLGKWLSKAPVQCPQCKTDLGHAVMVACDAVNHPGHSWVATQCPTVCRAFIWRLVQR